MLVKKFPLVFIFLPMAIMAEEPGVGAWPLPEAIPWSNVVLSPHDQIRETVGSAPESLGEILLGGEEGDPVVAIEDGVISFSCYRYCPTWRTSFSDTDLAHLRKEVAGMPGADQDAVHIMLCISSSSGAKIYYAGLSPVGPLPRTGVRVSAGQAIGRLGYAYPNMLPNLSIQGANRVGQNRILSLLGSPFPPLPTVKIKSRGERVAKDLLLKDIDVFWNALASYYPGLYDMTPRDSLGAALADLRRTIPDEGLTVGEFGNGLKALVRLFSDNHMSLWESYTPEDAVFLPIEIGAIDGELYVISSQIASLPKGSRIMTLDGVPADRAIAMAETQSGRSDGNLGTWERESLSRNAGRFWAAASGRRAGEKVVVELHGGSRSTITLRKQPVPGQADWWTRGNVITRSRGTAIPGFDDTQNIVIRRIAPGVDAITVASFDWTDLEHEAVDRYFTGYAGRTPTSIILDLRNNPGGEQRTEWDFLGHFIGHERIPFEYRTVVQKKISVVSGIVNLIDGDEKTFEGYSLHDNGTYRAYPLASERITAHTSGLFGGRLIILTNGMTGSAAFDAARLLQSDARALLVGRPGPHGTSRMIADKFARVYLPSSGVNLAVPMVKIVTEKDGESAPVEPLRIDYPVEISLDGAAGDKDPEWDLALDLVGSMK